VAITKAGGSWLADGQGVQTPVDDLAALHTDGSRKMTAPLNFDYSASVPNSGIFNAYIPWSGDYSDIFVLDEDEEAMWLASDQNVSFGVGSMFISSGQLTSFDYGSFINFEERSLGGGGWWIYSVLDDPNAIMSRSFADGRFIRSAVSNEHISLYCYADDPQQSHKKITIRAAAPGVGDVSAVVDPEEGFVVYTGGETAARLNASSMRLGTVDTEIEILGSDVYLYADASDPDHALNRRTGDNRYHQKSAITTPLKFDSSLSSEVNGLFKATVPWDAEYEFFTFNPTYETVVLSPTISSLGFEAANLIMNGYGTIRLKGESTYVSFEERMLAGGGWFVSTVENDPNAILNRTYADNRYVMQSAGITTNHTFQAGDVLQIQNGIITAINP